MNAQLEMTPSLCLSLLFSVEKEYCSLPCGFHLSSLTRETQTSFFTKLKPLFWLIRCEQKNYVELWRRLLRWSIHGHVGNLSLHLFFFLLQKCRHCGWFRLVPQQPFCNKRQPEDRHHLEVLWQKDRWFPSVRLDSQESAGTVHIHTSLTWEWQGSTTCLYLYHPILRKFLALPSNCVNLDEYLPIPGEHSHIHHGGCSGDIMHSILNTPYLHPLHIHVTF